MTQIIHLKHRTTFRLCFAILWPFVVDRLQKVLNAAARLIYLTRKFDHVALSLSLSKGKEFS